MTPRAGRVIVRMAQRTFRLEEQGIQATMHVRRGDAPPLGDLVPPRRYVTPVSPSDAADASRDPVLPGRRQQRELVIASLLCCPDPADRDARRAA
jgi:hypothetical protein